MDAPLARLSHQQSLEIKKFQDNAATQKKTIKEIAPGLLKDYRNLVAAMLVLNQNSDEYRQAVTVLESAEHELKKLKDGLKTATQALEQILNSLGKRPSLAEKDIVNPIDLGLPTDEKVRQLQALSSENEQQVSDFLKGIDEKYKTTSKVNFKTPEKITEKAQRPEIRRTKPWFDVEHIRDGFRFKTVIDDLSILPSIVNELLDQGFEVVKADTAKQLNPGMWGWRIVVFDLRMPNGQLVEYYLPARELEEAKNQGNHEIFEKWRNRDLSQLTPAEISEYAKDQQLSDDQYQAAWEEYLRRTDQDEAHIEERLQKVHEILGA